MCLGPCGPCTSLYSYPLGLASCIYQLPETWYRARVSTSLPCATTTSLPCCRRRAQGRRQRQVPRPPWAAPARSAPARRSARPALPLPRRAQGSAALPARPRPSFLCPRRAPPGAPRCGAPPDQTPPSTASAPGSSLLPWMPSSLPSLPGYGPRLLVDPPPSLLPLLLCSGRRGGRAHCRRRVPHRDGHRIGPCGCGRCPSCGGAGPEDPPPPIPSSPVVDPPPPPPPVAHQGSTVAALTASRAEHAARQARLREAALVWEREREAADAIAAQIVAAEQLLASPVTSSDTVGGVYGVPPAPTVGTGPRTIPTVLWHDPADPLVAQLHLQAGSVQNIRLMVPVVLEPESSS
jgi:hypothetical protein